MSAICNLSAMSSKQARSQNQVRLHGPSTQPAALSGIIRFVCQTDLLHAAGLVGTGVWWLTYMSEPHDNKLIIVKWRRQFFEKRWLRWQVELRKNIAGRGTYMYSQLRIWQGSKSFWKNHRILKENTRFEFFSRGMLFPSYLGMLLLFLVLWFLLWVFYDIT